MLASAFFTTLSLAALAASAPTKRASDPTYYARSTATGVNDIEVHLEFWGYSDGSPTKVRVRGVKGLYDNSPYVQGPFLYHLHTNAVGQARNCSTALGHLDPLHLTDSLVCDPAFPQYCQEGDLSGKHGKLNGTSSGEIDSFTYEDDYIRWFPQDLSILGRSVVIHDANKTRLACGDIISTIDGTASDDGHPTYSPSTYVTNYPTAAIPNPPQVVTPFVGEKFPDDATLQNLPFPLGNPAISLSESLNVQYTVQSQTVWVNGTQTQADLPIEHPSSDPPPFEGSTQDGSSWPWVA